MRYGYKRSTILGTLQVWYPLLDRSSSFLDSVHERCHYCLNTMMAIQDSRERLSQAAQSMDVVQWTFLDTPPITNNHAELLNVSHVNRCLAPTEFSR
jgi:hypothetical protein